MSVGFTGSFERSILGLPPDRANAVLDALDRFKADSSDQSLGFRPVHGVPGAHLIVSRHDDRVILVETRDGHFEAVDVGPYSKVMDRLGGGR